MREYTKVIENRPGKPSGKIYGYARVSTVGQTLDTQLNRLRDFGCKSTFFEKLSGARADRPELRRLIARLRKGDLVIVTRIDRLARSTFDLFAIVSQITAAGAQFVSIGEPWADTSHSTGRLMLAVLGGLADIERDLIRDRTAEGRARSIAAGRKMGRPPKLTEDEIIDVVSRNKAGESVRDIAKEFDLSPSTVARYVRHQSVDR